MPLKTAGHRGAVANDPLGDIVSPRDIERTDCYDLTSIVWMQFERVMRPRKATNGDERHMGKGAVSVGSHHRQADAPHSEGEENVQAPDNPAHRNRHLRPDCAVDHRELRGVDPRPPRHVK